MEVSGGGGQRTLPIWVMLPRGISGMVVDMSARARESDTGPLRVLRLEGPQEDSVQSLGLQVLTLLLGDVEGSVSLWESNEQSSAAAAIARMREMVAESADRHNGHLPLEQGEGDSFLAAFARPSQALECALQLQLAFAKEAWPTESPVRVRMALHTGDVEVGEDRRFVGHALNRCARVRALAHGEQVLISGATHALVIDSLPDEVTLKDLGEHRLRDLRRPERIYQLCHPDLPSEFAALRSLTALPNNLPLQLTTLIGREEEIEETLRLLTQTRVLTLTGAGGCGKTRLGFHVGAELIDHYPEGVWWVELAAIGDPALVPTIVARTLRVREVSRQSVTDSLIDSLKDRRLLLILDNCEHLVTACSDLATALVRGCPSLSILATSREPLGVEGETSFRVPSLAFGESDPKTPEELAAYDSTKLFLERARLVRPRFEITEENMAAVGLICRRLEGIPLALELAAARIRALSPERIAEQLSDRFRLLTGGVRGVLPRQRTLEASVDWSYQLLTEDERRLLHRLSVFTGSFGLEAAEEVGSGGGIDRYAVLDLLGRLVERSLVQVEEGADNRYRLLETIRFFARQKLTDSGEADEARTRHLDHYVGLAESAEPQSAGAVFRGLGFAELRGRLASELDNVWTALEWALASGQTDKHLRISSLDAFWQVQPPSGEALKSIEAALSAPGGDRRLRAKALATAAPVFLGAGESAKARSFMEESAAISRELGDDRQLQRALTTLGFWELLWEGQGVGTLDEAVRIAREMDDPALVVQPLMHLAVGQAFMGGLEAGMPSYEEAKALAQRTGQDQVLSFGTFAIGAIAGFFGHLGESRTMLARTIELAPGHAPARHFLAWTEASAGNFSAADELLDRSHSLAAALSRPRPLDRDLMIDRDLLAVRAFCLRAAGDFDAAVASAEKSLSLGRQDDQRIWVAMPLWILGATEIERGDLERADQLLEEAESLGRLPSFPYVLGRTLHHRGRLARARDDLQLAEDLQHEALETMMSLGDLAGLVEVLEALAGLATVLESHREAARLLGAAQRLRDETGYVRFPIDAPAWEADRSAAISALGEEEFEAAWTEGAGLSLEEAVSYAKRGRGERKRPSAGWASITPSEMEVVKLVAQGLPNPEIAKRLFITRNTVKVHLSHVFGKLGISTRAELAAEATRRGITNPSGT